MRLYQCDNRLTNCEWCKSKRWYHRADDNTYDYIVECEGCRHVGRASSLPKASRRQSKAGQLDRLNKEEDISSPMAVLSALAIRTTKENLK